MVICRLETQIGNKLDWKHKKKDWKQNKYKKKYKKGHWKRYFQIENKKLRLETQKPDRKQNKYIGNNLFRLETFTDMQGHNTMPSKLLKRVFINDK